MEGVQEIAANTIIQNEYIKHKALKKEDVRVLLDWASKQPHFPVTMSELFAIMALDKCYYSVEKAKQKLEAFLTARATFKEFFINMDPITPATRSIMDVCIITPLPTLTDEGYRIIYAGMVDSDIDKYDFVELVRLTEAVLWTFTLSEEGTNNGYCFIIDHKGGSLAHVLKTDIMSVKKLVQYLYNASLIHTKEFHIINPSGWTDKAVAILKLAVREKTLRNWHVHKNLDSLFQFVPQRYLPNELGGTAGTIKELHDKQNKILLSNSKLLHANQTFVADLSKRTENSNFLENMFGTEGTFKKLDID